MSSARQIGLIAAGSQPWNVDICAASASGDRFAYCATLAVYVYQMDEKLREFRLQCIMAEHKKTITAISWNPSNEDLIVTSGADGKIIVWDVRAEKQVANLDVTGNNNKIRSLSWGIPDKNSIVFISLRGPLQMWNFSSGLVISHKDIRNFASDVCQFRCHPLNREKIAFGHLDGTISISSPGHRIMKHAVQVGNADHEDDHIVGLDWDSLSVDYLLVITHQEGICLIDSGSAIIIMRFNLPSAAIFVHALSWIHAAPGTFVTGDLNSGVLRLWNVSKSMPIESIRIKKNGFHSLFVISHQLFVDEQNQKTFENGKNLSEDDLLHQQSSITHSVSSTQSTVPSNSRVLCTFTDGGVGLYDLAHRRWHFLREKGHIETIFDCKFSPDDPDLLATGSFDGTIKVWDVTTLKAVYTSAGNEGIIYCLSWSPSELNSIAASTSKKGAFIWDMQKGKVSQRFTEHKADANIYSIAWNQKNVQRIATAGSDCFCIIHQIDGKVVMKYPHPLAVFGCDWSPHHADILATGCADKNVRVFYLVTNSEKPVKVYSGHTAKVFQVKWSHLREGILVSGSDDGTIRMWDYTQDSCIRLFQGHTAPVRGLVWNPEIPYLLVSGSWDCSIRVWDTRDGACLDRMMDHGADVYGLACHPRRPFVMASCSRDSTVRLWSLTPLVQPLEMNILAGKSWDNILISPEHAMSLGTPPLLAGKSSRDIKLDLERHHRETSSKTLAIFSMFFGKPDGCGNLWELVNEYFDLHIDDLSTLFHKKGIIHAKNIVKFKSAEAEELEMAASLSKFGSGLGAPSHEERLRDAANINIKLGNVQKYCELLIELEDWDKALAIAPSVSMKYWKSLMDRRANHLTIEDDDDSVAYCIASGNTELLVRFLSKRGQHNDAFLVAIAANERQSSSDHGAKKEMSVLKSKDNSSTKFGSLLHQTSCDLADWYFYAGSPILAACCHLAVDDYERAMSKLIRGFELELAAALGQIVKVTDASLRLVLEFLAQRCERIGHWDLGVKLLKLLPGTEMSLAKLCVRCASTMIEINELHEMAGFPTLEECSIKADTLQSTGGSTFDCIMYFMLSSKPEIGLKLGLKEIIAVISEKQNWEVDHIYSMLQIVSSMQTEKLQKYPSQMSQLLVVSAYVGALIAIRNNYDSIVIPLFKHAIFLMKRDAPDVPLSQSLITREMESWESVHTAEKNKISLVISQTQRSVYDELIRKAGQKSSPIEKGMDFVLGSTLPSHSDVNISCLNEQRIQGPVHFLEDGFSALSMNDALMWAKVNPFSPLASGMRINPF